MNKKYPMIEVRPVDQYFQYTLTNKFGQIIEIKNTLNYSDIKEIAKHFNIKKENFIILPE